VGETKLQKEVQLASHHDEFAKEVRQNIQNGTKSHFRLRNGLLWYKQNWLYVPEGRMRDVLLKEYHDGPLAGLWAMVVQSASQHSSRNPIIGPT